MFPLSILPLPGELVPLHIFELRYKQLLEDAEQADITFGIYFSHAMNIEKIGALMKLESVIKRYPGGEADIIVKCLDVFYLQTLFRTFKSRMYPGGEVVFWKADEQEIAGGRLNALFQDYLARRNITRHQGFFSPYHMAQELSFDLSERYHFLMADMQERQRMLTTRIKFQMQLLEREALSRDLFHLN